MNSSFIALLTDFGTEDGYVAAMKGRILGLNPGAQLIDISHEIQTYNIRQAAFCLNTCYYYFPEKTIFVTVIDPGVGTKREGIVIQTSQHYFVGPNNGVFSFVYQREGYRAFQIQMQEFEDVSPTFHGRDVFAPMAAWLAEGKSLQRYLKPIRKLESFLKQPQQLSEKEFGLEVLHIDHFGNIILNWHQNDFPEKRGVFAPMVTLRNQKFSHLAATFGDVPAGELVLTWDSSGYLQIAQNKGCAADTLGCTVGDEVKLSL